MRFTFTVEAEVERTEGKFASRESIAEEIAEALESADPGSYSGDGESSYETVDWTVTEEDQQALDKQRKAAARAARKAREQAEKAEVAR